MKQRTITPFTILLTVFCLTLLSTSVFSLETDATNYTIGSTSQEASNSENQPTAEEVSISITVFNTTNTISIDSVSTVSPFIQSNDTNLNNINLVITEQSHVNGNQVLTLQGRIPEALDAVDSNGVASAFKVADLTLTDGNSTTTVEIKMQRENKLKFETVDLRFGDDDESVDDGEEIDDLKPGDSGVFDFEVENAYTISQDLEIDDIILKVVDNGNDLDINEEESIGSIRENDEDQETISIDIEDDLDEGKYTLLLRVTGEDEYGAQHGEQYEIVFDIEKEKNEISIRRVEVSPDSVTNCEPRAITLTTSIQNTGKRDQDDAVLKFTEPKLGISDSFTDLEVDEDDSLTKRFFVTIPQGADSGLYTFRIETYYNEIQKSDDKEVTIFVRDCNSNSEDDSERSVFRNANEIEGYEKETQQEQGEVQLLLPESEPIAQAPPVAQQREAPVEAQEAVIVEEEANENFISLEVLLLLLSVVILTMGIVAVLVLRK